MTDIILVTGEVVEVPFHADAAKETAILNFAATDAARKQANDAHAVSKAQLAPYIKELDPNGRKTGFLTSFTGVELEIQFKDSKEWDGTALAEAESVLGKKFEELFEKEVTIAYKAKRAALNKWLASTSSDEDENIAREVIRDAYKDTGKKVEPYIKVKKGEL